jgi:hypothetical protein
LEKKKAVLEWVLEEWVLGEWVLVGCLLEEWEIIECQNICNKNKLIKNK